MTQLREALRACRAALTDPRIGTTEMDSTELYENFRAAAEQADAALAAADTMTLPLVWEDLGNSHDMLIGGLLFGCVLPHGGEWEAFPMNQDCKTSSHATVDEAKAALEAVVRAMEATDA